MPFGIILLILFFMKDRIESMMSHGITGLERVKGLYVSIITCSSSGGAPQADGTLYIACVLCQLAAPSSYPGSSQLT
jgi:hypothetical protein